MTFKPGQGGRQKGAINLRTRHAQEVLARLDFNPIAAMAEIYKISMQKFIEELDAEDSGRISRMESNAAKYLGHALQSAGQLAPYVYPKLKSVEHVRTSDVQTMSPKERLEAMKNAVKVLEQQIEKSNEPGGS